MGDLKVFIASASSAMNLGEALCKELRTRTRARERSRSNAPATVDDQPEERQPVHWHVSPWWDNRNDVQKKGQPLLYGLLDECKKADLAVILLTADDLTNKGGVDVLEPRDNCIFEAGLFMGGLGLDPQRSLIITSVKPDALPSDLRGIEPIGFPPPTPEQLKDKRWCRKTMRQVVKDLEAQVERLTKPPARPSLPILTPDDLLRLERPEPGGMLKVGGGTAVVINTTHPTETQQPSRARQVVANMAKRVEYVYFFRAEQDHIGVVITLLQSLVSAYLAEEGFAEPQKKQADDILRALEALEPRLFIHFVPDNRAPLLFCVHNAGDYDSARCYLRDVSRDRFFLWAEGKDAFAVAADLRKLQRIEDDRAIFYPTQYYDLYGSDGLNFRQRLKNRLISEFRDVLGAKEEKLARLKEICFLNLVSPKEAAKELDVSEEKVILLIQNGHLAAERFDRELHIKRTVLDRYMSKLRSESRNGVQSPPRHP